MSEAKTEAEKKAQKEPNKLPKLPTKGTISIKTANDKLVLPFSYEGKIVKVRHKEFEKIDVEKLPYESKIIIKRALRAKEIIKK